MEWNTADGFYKNDACEHALISTMIVDKPVQVPGGMSLRRPKVTPTTLEGAMMADTSNDSEASAEYGDDPRRSAIEVPPPKKKPSSPPSFPTPSCPVTQKPTPLVYLHKPA